ncbi:MBL fold metallo-hydrolase [Corynebacterium kalidii]|uniref:MBL fold metallo-hydrolase n=1 Tax=Corynebacterium kalidii TaxID=2931982 RepID=A0A9X2AZ26_9CORY|nr:MBL fold metallo-hydrolase [Corynebacterium kalidii]MCJ7858686.1 MBL fold metallo-hydrolase [Corynebacterium kalidii]
MASAQITTTTVGPMGNNCYLVSAGGDALLIDAADEAGRLLSVAADAGVRITDVLTTHRHHDHVGALQEVLAATGARHHASVQDAPELPASVDQTWGHHPDDDAPEPFTTSSPALDALGMQLILLRGHTAGGLGVLVPQADGPDDLFSGDSLFPGGVGKTATPEDFASLTSDVARRCFTLLDDTRVHPGHGAGTTIGAERPHLGEWLERGW